MRYEILSQQESSEIYLFGSDAYHKARNSLSGPEILIMSKKRASSTEYILVSRRKANLSGSLPFATEGKPFYSERRMFCSHPNVWTATFYDAHDLMCAASKNLKNFLFFNMNSL